MLRTQDGHATRSVLPVPAGAHQPVLLDGAAGVPEVLWNEWRDGLWSIRCCRADGEADGAETIFESERLCLPPAAISGGGTSWAAWPGLDDGSLRIYLAERGAGAWGLIGPVSHEGPASNRPALSLLQGRVCVVWDRYHDGTYEIAGGCWENGRFEELSPSRPEPGRKWFCPDILAVGENAFVCWVDMQEVSDGLGIAEHACGVMIARITDGGFENLHDPDQPADTRIIADLREGLLPATIYKGHPGLRRRPSLAAGPGGRLGCFWEVRMEDEPGSETGSLACRVFDGSRWDEPCLLGGSGYGYAVPRGWTDEEAIPASWFDFPAAGLDILRQSTFSLPQAVPHRVASSRWNRWQKRTIVPLRKNRGKFEVDGRQYGLFWADTHCHSNFSADAEGEPDEIIHAGIEAGLDAMCVIDNDYYPNKALTPAEWQVHQELSRHFTRPGQFVLFSGYEFTCHRDDLDPDFNHRCVIYPRPGGPLLRRIDPATRTDRDLLAALGETDGMAYPHHCSWELIDPNREWNAEVCSSWRVCMEESNFMRQQLRAGRRLGFIGSSDAHRATPGLGGALTGLYATELTPEALFDAYRNRRTVATQGFAIWIDFRAAGVFIGGQGRTDTPPELSAEVQAPDVIEQLSILRDGEVIYQTSPGETSASLGFRDEDLTPGQHFYFLKVQLAGEPSYNFPPEANSLQPFTRESRYPHNLARARGVFAWTSPIWLDCQPYESAP